jgi:two-component system C4-dicarboxylate transport sensor histidine kinase DctB
MPSRRRSAFIVAVAVVLIGVVGWFAASWTVTRAQATADAAAAALARGQAGLLTSELQKFRLLPLVLTEYPDLVRATRPDGEPNVAVARARLNRTFELLAQRTDAAVIYAIDAQGRTVAASNWRLPTSFVGQDYGFRPYFREAMRRGDAELFALGTVSRRPGLYLARRVEREGKAAGVIVVKVEFDALEAAWRHAAGITLAVDAHGVILVTGIAAWRFDAIAPLDRATIAAARATRQFGRTVPARAPLLLRGSSAEIADEPYRAADAAVPLAGGRVLALVPLRPALAAARTQALLWALAIVFAVGFAGGAVLRAGEKRRLARDAHDRLEEEVAHRTSELRDANTALVAESGQRADAERRFRAAREELAQANRLGLLGQIVAGVAHEINQPVAAIRTFADNGVVLIERDRTAAAIGNLGRIAALADRIGTITAELRSFARRATPASGIVPIGAVLDGVRLLMGDANDRRIVIAVSGAERAVRVVGDRIRLEQIVVNLLTNALDATADLDPPAVTITATLRDDSIDISVSDRGAGVPAALRSQLFAPFVTAKPEGLGLGLAIARNIAREMGGDLVLADAGPPGATFVLTLRRA